MHLVEPGRAAAAVDTPRTGDEGAVLASVDLWGRPTADAPPALIAGWEDAGTACRGSLHEFLAGVDEQLKAGACGTPTDPPQTRGLTPRW